MNICKSALRFRTTVENEYVHLIINGTYKKLFHCNNKTAAAVTNTELFTFTYILTSYSDAPKFVTIALLARNDSAATVTIYNKCTTRKPHNTGHK